MHVHAQHCLIKSHSFVIWMAHSEPYVQKTMFLFLCYGNLTLNRKIKIIAIWFFFLDTQLKVKISSKGVMLKIIYFIYVITVIMFEFRQSLEGKQTIILFVPERPINWWLRHFYPPPRQLIVFKVVTNLESVKILFKFQLLYWSIKGPQGAIKRLYNKQEGGVGWLSLIQKKHKHLINTHK